MPESKDFPKALFYLSFLCMALTGPAGAASPPGACPQTRTTTAAPPEFLARTNPLPATPEVAAAGERMFAGKGKSVPCTFCHGAKGDGKGYLATQYDPRPRNFNCKETMSDISDGQLFWIIQNGSPGAAMPPSTGSSMPASRNLTDEEIWQLVRYVRTFVR
jgi:mono/diheme cytochrome c family protein